MGSNNTTFRNRIINGAMQVWQRGTSFTLSSGVTTYTADRWYVNTTGGAGVVSQTGTLGAYSLRLTGASGVTSGFIGQKIESVNIADCAGSTVTYKIRASSSTLTSLTWYARNPNTQDNYGAVTLITSGVINITSTPTDYLFQIALPSGAANGLEVYFAFGAFTSGILDITGVQLEKGTVATPFEQRLYGTELQLCQRYYELVSWVPHTTNTYQTIYYKVTKRASPTVAFVAGDTTPTVSVNGSYTATESFYQSGNSSAITRSTWSATAEL